VLGCDAKLPGVEPAQPARHNGAGVNSKKPPELTCPKCGAPMRTHKRNGVTIEQCTSCHGIFLDRGELERLISAESSFLAVDPPPQ
jgi:ribosomal protein L37AE/L43A